MRCLLIALFTFAANVGSAHAWEIPATGSCVKLHSGFPPRKFGPRFAGSFKWIRSLIFSGIHASGRTIRGNAPLTNSSTFAVMPPSLVPTNNDQAPVAAP